MTEPFTPLGGELTGLFARGVDESLSDAAFGAFALRVFVYQYAGCASYRALCDRRGVTPETVERWQDVPLVPATAFKHLDFLSSDRSPEAIFRTSGTTSGRELRGRHLVPSLDLYRASLRPNFRAHLLPEGEALPLLSLVPPPSAAPESSLSTMVGDVADTMTNGVWWLAEPDTGVDTAGFLAAAEEVASRGAPVLLTATAFALVHLLDAMTEAGRIVRFPEGTRLMETGGFKGRAKEVAREALYASVEERLGVPAGRIVNEYGMTELLSQLYEPVLREGPATPRRHVAPPWLKVRALDPATLEPLGEGEVGVLAFFDLANVGSVSHILTQDFGSVAADGVRLQGRAPGAEPRGCSMAMEEVLAATEARR